MTILALSLFILACGWKFTKDWRFTRYAALKNAGHPQYFGAAIAAAYVGCLAASMHELSMESGVYRELVSNALTYLPTSSKNAAESKVIATLAAVAGWSFLLSCFLSWTFNRPLFRDPALLVAVARKVGAMDELEALCLKCLETGMLLAVTLKSGKVYVGVPEGYSAIGDEKKWLAIWPMASGYRDDKHKLELTTYYSPQYEIAESGDNGGLQVDDFRVILPKAEISTAQSFDLSTYASFGVNGLSSAGVEADAEASFATGDEEPNATYENHIESMIDAVNAGSIDVGGLDNAAELTAEIIPHRDAKLLNYYFGFVIFFSLAVLLASGSWLSAPAFALAAYSLMRAQHS